MIEIKEIKNPLFEGLERIPSDCGAAYKRINAKQSLNIINAPQTKVIDIIDIIFNTPDKTRHNISTERN